MSLSNLIRYIKSKTYHNCNNHQMYFEEYNVRGIYCGICLEIISSETDE